MRNSWYGTPPQSWEQCRFKDFLRLITDRSYSNNKVGLENIESGTGQYIKTDTEFEGNGIAFKENDLLYGKLRPYLQKVYDADFKGNAIGDIYVFRCKPNAHHLFIKYVLLSDCFTTITNSVTAGAKMPRVSADFILGLPFGLPDLKTQIKISEYLENKNQNINKRVQLLIKKQEYYLRLKKTLINSTVCHGLNPNAEMKDSGIDWIGKIPQNWEIHRLKDLYKESKEVSATGKEILLSVSEYYGVAKKSDKMGEDEVYESRAESLVGYKICHKGDLVVNIMLAWKKGLGTSNYEGIVSPAYSVYKPHNICPSYYHYLLRSEQAITEFKRYSKGIIDSRLRLYTDRFYNIKTPYPPLVEQEAIANYLDDKCSKIDTIVEKISEEINLLGKLKKSLINEVITGKRTV